MRAMRWGRGRVTNRHGRRGAQQRPSSVLCSTHQSSGGLGSELRAWAAAGQPSAGAGKRVGRRGCQGVTDHPPDRRGVQPHSSPRPFQRSAACDLGLPRRPRPSQLGIAIRDTPSDPCPASVDVDFFWHVQPVFCATACLKQATGKILTSKPKVPQQMSELPR